MKSFGGPKNDWKRLKDASGRTFNGDGLDNIKVLSCQPDWIAVAEFPVFLLRKMRDLEVLDLSVSGFVGIFQFLGLTSLRCLAGRTGI